MISLNGVRGSTFQAHLQIVGVDVHTYLTSIPSRHDVETLGITVIGFHQEAGTPDDKYTLEMWMIPLVNLWIHSYERHWQGHEDKLFKEIVEAFKAGLAGDLQAVDNFIGGYELAQEEPKPMARGRIVEDMNFVCIRELDEDP